MNKEIEQFYLDKFRENYPQFPEGEVCPDERPDFLVKTKHGMVGIEMTHFFREMSDGRQTTLQQQMSTRAKIIKLAQTMCDAKGMPGRRVGVYFDRHFHCRHAEISSIATRLVQLAEPSLSGQQIQNIWRRDDIQINGIDMLDIADKIKLSKSYWRTWYPNFPPSVAPPQIQNILEAKSKRYEDYRKKCNQVWLVIVMNRFDASSFSLIPESTLDHLYAHVFDSAFLFFYDYTPEQRPPFLLRRS